ncbi:hypothetical protein DNH61_16295 [Paenibacillus sambharensis]|uniref:Uncharacterized protein n=1 Tax=Paenibacillus sambharensis TaxID=1803190 RepID=A0A2W1L7K0_9BACL|nr:Ig-like domain-containing protein [Paenibacillus sambharensis]PZD94789.1 hypothetical protein DNH61_16295 [Paenibacillus sambharensis]
MGDNQGPVIKMQAGGSAPVISYSVPETIAYTGRNFIELQLGENIYRGGRGSAAKLGSRTLTSSSGTAEKVIAAEEQPLVYRSMSGELVSTTVPGISPAAAFARAPLPIHEEGGPVVMMRPRDDIDRDPIPEEPDHDISVSITSPAPGGTVNGPHTGATFTVTGKASAVGGTVASVQVRIGSQSWQTAGLGTGGSWTLTNAFADSPGPVVIRAVATHVDGYTTAAREITVHIALSAEPDTVPPTVSITSPAGGYVPGGSEETPILVRGTASDNRAITTVEVAVNDGAFQPAESGDNWLNWSRTVKLSGGTNTIHARCVDAAGLEGRTSMVVTVDVEPPSITITSPKEQAELTGVEPNGVLVEVTGTSSDANGVQAVELTVGHNPVWVPVQPKALDDWSSWSGKLTLTDPGLNFITARCRDKANNTTEVTIPVRVSILPDVVSHSRRLFLVEKYMLSTYLGSYGAGRVLKTFSLLPGEKTKISIKSYQSNETKAQKASSILDSFNAESAQDFEKSLMDEQSDQKQYKESFKYTVDGEAKASWGWGSARISASVSSDTNGAREEFAKNVSNSIQKHAAKASSQREVQVNTSTEERSLTSEESTISREVENINVSRTLNYVFRQMNQEYISVLHLVDVRVGYYEAATVDGKDADYYREVPLPQLNNLLNDVIAPEARVEVRNSILHQLTNIFDYKDRHHRFVEETPFLDEEGKIIELSSYLRVKKDYVSEYYDDATGTTFNVPGIILAANKYVMRTEGIVVEALLGQGEALDSYSKSLQDETIRGLELKNQELYNENRMRSYALTILQKRDELAARLYQMLNQPEPAEKEDGDKPSEPSDPSGASGSAAGTAS